ncbi:MAG: hypothetical protein HFI09_02030 [Bacilli bacterium]|nr:hypothetical protein [Bacilli bacterium]
MKNRKRIFKIVGMSSLTFILGLMAIAVVLFFLVSYLFQIQVPERLKYVKDYTDFVLEIEPVANCVDDYQKLFQYDGVVYGGICVSNVFVKYGNTKAPLSFILEQKYIGLKELKRKFQRIQGDDGDIIYYEYRQSENERENYRVTIQPKQYQNVFLQEVTFELFS